MSTWAKNSEGLIITGEVIRGPEVLPPQPGDRAQWRRTLPAVYGAGSALAFLLLLAGSSSSVFCSFFLAPSGL
jgi:hypothetical protein